MTQNTNPWGKAIDPLAQDIAAVLRRMGGSAHQQDVVQCVAAMKRQRGEAVAQDLASKIVEAFERYRDLFFRPSARVRCVGPCNPASPERSPDDAQRKRPVACATGLRRL
jgi:hypothetical protein